MQNTPLTLIRGHKQDGQFVHQDDPICELESGPAIIDLPAWSTGTLHHLANPGDTFPATTQFARIDPKPAPS